MSQNLLFDDLHVCHSVRRNRKREDAIDEVFKAPGLTTGQIAARLGLDDGETFALLTEAMRAGSVEVVENVKAKQLVRWRPK